jgi:hypothetical protein
VNERPPLEVTPLQLAQRAFFDNFAAAGRLLSLEQRRVLWEILAVRLAHEAARDADWSAWEGPS